MNSEEFHGALYRERCRREAVESKNRLLLATLKGAMACLETANNTPNGPIIDTIWYGPAETLFDYIDAALEKVGADRTAPEGHNAKVTGAPPTDANKGEEV